LPWLTVPRKWSFWAALPVAALIAGAIGALLALPAMRVRGPYLAMVTIAFGFVSRTGHRMAPAHRRQNGIMGCRNHSLSGFALASAAYAIAAIVLAPRRHTGFSCFPGRGGARDARGEGFGGGGGIDRARPAAHSKTRPRHLALCAGVAGALSRALGLRHAVELHFLANRSFSCWW